MIKVNLLDSVTDRTRSVAVVEAQVSNPRVRSWMLMAVVAALSVAAMGVEYVSAKHSNETVKEEHARQEEIAKKMEGMNKQQAELEKKIEEVRKRIEAIKKLRASQQGPVALLSELNMRLPSERNFSLTSVEQKNGELIIDGHSSNEAAVTEFARSLENTNGLFSNVTIEIERSTIDPQETEWKPEDGEIDAEAPKPEVVKFIIKCNYGPQPEPKTAPAAPAKPAPAAPPAEAAKS